MGGACAAPGCQRIAGRSFQGGSPRGTRDLVPVLGPNHGKLFESFLVANVPATPLGEERGAARPVGRQRRSSRASSLGPRTTLLKGEVERDGRVNGRAKGLRMANSKANGLERHSIPFFTSSCFLPPGRVWVDAHDRGVLSPPPGGRGRTPRCRR